MNSVLQTKLNIKRPLGLFLVGIFLGITPVISCGASSVRENKYVEYVIDGDTFSDSKGFSYRLFGVDTPEHEDESYTEYMYPIRQYWSVLAMDHTERLMENKTITIEKITKDVYDRQVCKWEIGGIDVGISLVENGLAMVRYISADEEDLYHTFDYDYYNELLLAQKKAYDENIGIWALNDEDFKEIYE